MGKFTLIYNKKQFPIIFDDDEVMTLGELMSCIANVTGLPTSCQKIIGLTDKYKSNEEVSLTEIKLKKKMRMIKAMSEDQIKVEKKAAEAAAAKVTFKDEDNEKVPTEGSERGRSRIVTLESVNNGKKKSEQGPMWQMALAMSNGDKEEARSLLLRMPPGMSLNMSMPNEAEMRHLHENANMMPTPDRGVMGPMDSMILNTMRNMSNEDRMSFHRMMMGQDEEEVGNVLGDDMVGPSVESLAPNTLVHDSETGELAHMLDAVARFPSSPLVVMFVSAAYMTNAFLDNFVRLSTEFLDTANFVCVYLYDTERESASVEVGMERCRSWLQTFDATVTFFIDTSMNESSMAYEAFPSRQYVLGRDGRVLFKSSLGGFVGENLEQLRSFLQSLRT